MENVWRQITEELMIREAQLIAVSKTKPADEIERLYAYGQRAFGENRVQELLQKVPLLPSDIEWHLIGHLQRNKVKSVLPFVHTIHSVDSIRLYREILKQAKNIECSPRILLQMKIADEESKYGLDFAGAAEILDLAGNSESGIKIAGLMGMATFTDDVDQVRNEFRNLRMLRDELRAQYASTGILLNQLSMGMSGDYRIALDEGSTMVRIGSLLFGPR